MDDLRENLLSFHQVGAPLREDSGHLGGREQQLAALRHQLLDRGIAGGWAVPNFNCSTGLG